MTPTISAKYASSPQIFQRVESRTGTSSDILVSRRSTNNEFILHGVYQIARNEFYFNPDGSFDPPNAFRSYFQDVKLGCRLTAPLSSVFEFAQDDFPACIENLRGLEKLIKHNNGEEVISSMSERLGTAQFTLTHALLSLSRTLLR
jgi:hypothetical protein